MEGFFIIGGALIVCGVIFVASVMADEGIDLPSIDFGAILNLIPVKRKPRLCPKTNRWRDPVTNKFVKTPAFARS